MPRGASIAAKATAEALLVGAIVVVLVTDVLDGTPLDRWPFVVGNIVVGLLGWVRPAYAGWTLIGLFAALGLVVLVGGDTLEASTVSVVWGRSPARSSSARSTSPPIGWKGREPPRSGRRRGRAWCRIGIHEYVTATAGDERFLRCKHCGKYGGAGGAWGAFTYRR